jgi:hypothetical protein
MPTVRGFCSESNRGLSGPSKTLCWDGGHRQSGCGDGVLVGWLEWGRDLMCNGIGMGGGYRNRPFKSWHDQASTMMKCIAMWSDNVACQDLA